MLPGEFREAVFHRAMGLCFAQDFTAMPGFDNCDVGMWLGIGWKPGVDTLILDFDLFIAHSPNSRR
jgi:hypothetical protein